MSQQLLGEVIRVGEQVNLASLALHCQVMTELALESFCTLACSEVLTHNRFGVDTCRHTHLHIQHAGAQL